MNFMDVLSNVLDHGVELSDAVAQARFTCADWLSIEPLMLHFESEASHFSI